MKVSLAVAAATCLGALALALAAACAENPQEPGRGAIRVRAPLLPYGQSYRLSLDGGAWRTAYDGEILADLVTGVHRVAIRLSSNDCIIDGDNPRTVTVMAGRIVDVEFTGTCGPGAIEVTVATSGTNTPSNHRLRVGEIDDFYCYTCHTDLIVINFTMRYEDLRRVEHRIELLSVPPNCAVTPSRIQHALPGTAGDPARVLFRVACT